MPTQPGPHSTPSPSSLPLILNSRPRSFPTHTPSQQTRLLSPYPPPALGSWTSGSPQTKSTTPSSLPRPPQPLSNSWQSVIRHPLWPTSPTTTPPSWASAPPTPRPSLSNHTLPSMIGSTIGPRGRTADSPPRSSWRSRQSQTLTARSSQMRSSSTRWPPLPPLFFSMLRLL